MSEARYIISQVGNQWRIGQRHYNSVLWLPGLYDTPEEAQEFIKRITSQKGHDE